MRSLCGHNILIINISRWSCSCIRNNNRTYISRTPHVNILIIFCFVLYVGMDLNVLEKYYRYTRAHHHTGMWVPPVCLYGHMLCMGLRKLQFLVVIAYAIHVENGWISVSQVGLNVRSFSHCLCIAFNKQFIWLLWIGMHNTKEHLYQQNILHYL